MPASGFREDTRDRDAGTSSRGTSFAPSPSTGTLVGICEAFRKINIVGQPEHGRAQARILSGLLSRMPPLLTRRIIINMSNHFLSGRARWTRRCRASRFPAISHVFDSRVHLAYVSLGRTTDAENYPSKLAIDRTISRSANGFDNLAVLCEFTLSYEKNVSRFPF